MSDERSLPPESVLLARKGTASPAGLKESDEKALGAKRPKGLTLVRDRYASEKEAWSYMPPDLLDERPEPAAEGGKAPPGSLLQFALKRTDAEPKTATVPGGEGDQAANREPEKTGVADNQGIAAARHSTLPPAADGSEPDPVGAADPTPVEMTTGASAGEARKMALEPDAAAAADEDGVKLSLILSENDSASGVELTDETAVHRKTEVRLESSAASSGLLELRGVTPDSDQATELSKTSADTANREVGLLRQMRTISLVFLLVLLVGIGIGIWSVWKPQSTDTVASSEEGTGQVPLDGKTPPIAPAQDNGLAQDSAAGEAAAINEAPGAPPSQSEDAGEVQRSANSQGELPNAKAVDAERNPIGVESGADAVVNLTAGTGPLSAPQPASGEEVQIGSETSVPGQISDRVDQDGVAARQVILPQEDQGNGGASEGTTSQGTTSQGTTSIEDLIKATDPAAAEVPTTGEDADRTAALTVGGTSPGTQSDLPPAPSRKPLTELETSRIPVVTPDPVGYVVQLYSAKNLAAAEAEGLRLSESLKAALGGGGLAIETADVPDSGTFYRLRSQTLETRAAADSLCAQFKQLGQDCLVVKRQ